MSLGNLNTQAISDKVAAQIKLAFIDLMTEDDWKRLVKAQIDSFLTKEPVAEGYDSRTREQAFAPNLKKMVHDHCAELFRKHMMEKLASEEFQKSWNEAVQGFEASDFVKAVLRDSGPELLKGFFANLLNRTVQQVISQVQMSLTQPMQPPQQSNSQRY